MQFKLLVILDAEEINAGFLPFNKSYKIPQNKPLVIEKVIENFEIRQNNVSFIMKSYVCAYMYKIILHISSELFPLRLREQIESWFGSLF